MLCGGRHVLNKACLTRDTFRMHPGSKANSTAVASSSSADTSSFDVQAYDAERLRLDEQARSQMKQQASSMPSTGPGAWKWQYRKSMWDRMEAEDIARCELEAYKCKLACSNVHPLWYVPVQTFVQAPASRKLLLEGSEWHRKSEMFEEGINTAWHLASYFLIKKLLS
eukprot:scaffold36872_cov18-Tisochrysis_lutea.AAC.1